MRTFIISVVAAAGLFLNLPLTFGQQRNVDQEVSERLQRIEWLQNQRWEALSEIGKFGLEARTAAPTLFKLLEDEGMGVEALASMGPEIIPEIKRQFKSKSPEYRQHLLSLVDAMGEDAVPLSQQVVWALNGADRDLRLRIVKVLGEIPFDSEIVVPALIKQLDSDDSFLVAETAWSLSTYRADATPAFERLKLVFQTVKPFVDSQTSNFQTYARRRALDALPEIMPNSDELRSILIEALLLKDVWEDPWGWSPSRDALKALADMKIDIRAAESNLLAIVKSPDIQTDPAKFYLASELLARIRSKQAMATFRDYMNRPLSTYVEDEDIEDSENVPQFYECTLLRTLSARAITMMEPDDADARKVLAEVAQQREWLALEKEGSGQFGWPMSPLMEAIEVLTRLDNLDATLVSSIDELQVPDDFWRIADTLFWFRARHVPGFVDDPNNLKDVPFYTRYTKTPTPDEIASWLGDRLDNLLPQLADDYFLDSSEGFHHQASMARLKILTPKQMAAVVDRGFSKLGQPDIRGGMWESVSVSELLNLARNYKLDFDSLAPHIESGYDETRTVALQMLGETGCASEQAIQALIEGLSDPKPLVRMRAAQSLGKLGPAAVAARENLHEAMQDDYYAVRAAAELASRRIDGK